ncbi:hypothetical protein NE237_015178 [Protea cynaroides]|uniref:GDSL esterase/lipase n=1 Tax=Protea cynaroides TaxID=273540 RepID=A0A9Q0KDI1_9MAGN|nr:hypothetical protein NE237_015178 [Protea cynaroides]
MRNSGGCIGVLFFCLLASVSPVKSGGPLAPALYVFGDSLVDCGNNNYLSTIARANNPPYGVDFPDGSTGRFTNGKTVPDFIAASLGLPLVPPYLGLSQVKRNKTTTGMNYGSGSAGILPETGTIFGSNLNLETQINMFEETVNRNLPYKFQSTKELSQYLSKSIFLVDIGSSDFIDPYLPGHSTNLSRPTPQNNPQDFAKFLIGELAKHLQRLYQLGARKFVVFEVGPTGCLPAITSSNGLIGGCMLQINLPVTRYNQKLPLLLNSLKSSLKGSIFSLAKIYSLWMQGADDKAGNAGLITDTMNACCLGPNNGTLPCTASESSCKNANEHVFFDGYHPTEVVNSKVAASVFSDSLVCSPMSVEKLAKA